MKRKIIVLPAAIVCSAGTVPAGDTPWYLVGGIVGYVADDEARHGGTVPRFYSYESLLGAKGVSFTP